MHNKKLKYRFTYVLLAMLISVSSLTACSDKDSAAVGNSNSAASEQTEVNGTETKSGLTQTVSSAAKTDISVEYEAEDEDSDWSSTDSTSISLKSDSITYEGNGVAVQNNIVTITSAGTYIINGTIRNGQLRVDTDDKAPVRLVLNGANITSLDSAPIYIIKAKKAVIVLAEGTKNNLTDSKTYTVEDNEADEPNSTIFSKSDLTINGTGSLTVNANYKNAITSKDELKVMSGNIAVNSAGDGIRGRDFVAIKNGVVNINSQEDGIKSNNDEDAEKGFVLIEGGTVNITAQEDGIQAETNIIIKAGDIDITSGGGSANGEVMADEQPGGMRGSGKGFDRTADSIQSSSSASAQNNSDEYSEENAEESSASTGASDSKKGIKASVGITINGGTISIDSADDSIHSNNSIFINGGTITALSGDDGIHADTSIEINDGNINIMKAYEGIESAKITINKGNVYILANDDGINISGGNDNSSMRGRPGQNNINSTSNDSLYINGGYVYIEAGGDGLDANGSIYMSNGTVVVNGPTSNFDASIDYDGAFKMTGGFLVAAGSAGMAQSPDTSSTQNSAVISFTETMSAGTLFNIQTAEGKQLLTFKPSKAYQTIVFSSPELTKGANYDIYYGGSSTGTEKDGLYTGGTYTGGTKYQSFSVSDTITTIGTAGRGGPGEQGFMNSGKRRAP